MSDRANIERLYQEWFAVGKELFRTDGVLKFVQHTLKITNALLEVPEFRNSIPDSSLPRLEEALMTIAERHAEVAPQIDLTNKSVTTPRNLIKNAERILLRGGLFSDYPSTIDLVSQTLLIKAQDFEADGYATRIPEKSGEYMERDDNYLAAIRGSLRHAANPRP